MDGYPSERFDAKVVKIVGRFEADPRLGFEIDVVFVIWQAGVVFFCNHWKQLNI